MPRTKKPAAKPEPKQYLTQVPRRLVWWCLGVLAVVVISLFLFVPHYKPLRLASTADLNEAHKAIIAQYFLQSTNCANDNEDKASRVKEFNQYFKVNKYGNRAVIRGCNDNDSLLAKAEEGTGTWDRTDVNIILSSRQNPTWQQACLIDDITTADTKVRPENSSIDAFNLATCDGLRKQSYIEVHFHF